MRELIYKKHYGLRREVKRVEVLLKPDNDVQPGNWLKEEEGILGQMNLEYCIPESCQVNYDILTP